MLSKTLRKNFIEYFKSKGHSYVPSSPVIPHDDPTLLFINAGMNQFKDVFLGSSKRDYTKATSVQKCIRVGGKHNDLDNVGHTTRHMTFFEMLGNFSFGDYFKKEAIAFAYEVTMNVFQLEENRIWVSVFETDDEAFELWKKYIPENRIVRMGEKDNFWAMGETGPCGPCSELYYDQKQDGNGPRSPAEDPDGERFLEFWNLVFMQYNKDSSGKMHPLPKPCVDTGAGLERILVLKNGLQTVFQTDPLMCIIQKIEELSNVRYDVNNPDLAPAFHVIADHLRSLAFAIADGAIPSNIEQGYVLRKILRRALRYGKLLGLEKPFLGELIPLLASSMGEDYPELVSSIERTQEILSIEEESFIRTLKRGGNILQSIIANAIQSKNKQITGEEAFKLKDTYGFPIEEILLLAKDAKLSVNLDAFELLEEQAKERSRKAKTSVSQEALSSIFSDFASKNAPTEFCGYETLSDEATIMAIVKDGAFVEKLSAGEEGLFLLNKTPFYAEKGGQVGDQGWLHHENAQFEVLDCLSPYTGIIAHHGKVVKGTFLVGEPIQAQVDPKRRKEVAIHHSATHLLNYALTQTLGEHIKQAGSLVEPTYLRFDFNHHKALTKEELREIEHIVNEKIREATDVQTYEKPFEEIQQQKEIKQFFGDKYGAIVRVVDIGGYSKELCGGTHIENLSSIGLFRIKKESSIAAGVRRIEAVCGTKAMEMMYEDEDLIEKACEALRANKGTMMEKIHQLFEEQKLLKEQLEHHAKKELSSLATALHKEGKTIHNLFYIAKVVAIDPKHLTELGNQLIEKIQSGILLLAIKTADRVQLLIKLSKDLQEKGLSAQELMKQIAPIVDGRGGGKADMAQAGGKNPGNTDLAIEEFIKLLKSSC